LQAHSNGRKERHPHLRGFVLSGFGSRGFVGLLGEDAVLDQLAPALQIPHALLFLLPPQTLEVFLAIHERPNLLLVITQLVR
jgi:hypothetical protein